MGVFDNIIVEYPLPGLLDRGWDWDWQTKDTPAQFMDVYKIDGDGELWHQAYEIEDQSDPNAEGIRRFVGTMTRVNKRWEAVPTFTGTIRFYDGDASSWHQKLRGWWEYEAVLLDGMVVDVSGGRVPLTSPENNP